MIDLEFDRLIVAENVESLLVAAAIRRLFGGEFKIEFCDILFDRRYDCSHWAPESRALLVGLTEVFGGETQMSAYLKAVNWDGHSVVGILDTVGEGVWREAFESSHFRYEELKISPLSGDLFAEDDERVSFRDYFLSLTGKEDDEFLRELFAESTDGNLTVREIIDRAILGSTNTIYEYRYEYLIEHFAHNAVPSEKICNWINQFEVQAEERDNILNARQDLGNGIWRIQKDSLQTSLITFNLAGQVQTLEQARIVVFNLNTTQGRKVSFSMNTADGSRFLELLEEDGIAVTGTVDCIVFSAKVEQRAIELIRQALVAE